MPPSKKNKARPRRLSLRDRLAGHWRSGKWESFAALYLRDRAAAEATRLWAGRLTDALFNALTKVLFLDRDPAAAEELAALLVAEAENGGDRTAADCGRLALYFIRLKSGGPAAAGPPPGGDAALPAPYQALRAGLAAYMAGPAAGGGGPAAALKKLAGQIRALPGAKTLTPCTALLKTAEELEKASGGEPAFKAVRHIAALLRESQRRGRAGEALRDLGALVRHPDFRAIPKGAQPPAVLSLWETFRRAGGEKFGPGWAAAVGLLARLFEDRRGMRRAVESLLAEDGLPPPLRPLVIAQARPGRSDQERYLLACLSLYGLLDLEDMEEDAAGTALKHLQVVSELGGKWRNGVKPWPPQVCKAVEKFLAAGGPGFAKNLAALKPPLAGFSPSGLLHLLLKAPELRADVEKAAAGRPPLTLNEEDFTDLGESFALSPPSPAGLKVIAGLLAEKSLARLLAAWLETLIESSAVRVAGGRTRDLPWDKVSGGLWAGLLELLPAGGRLAAFVRLGLDGGGPRRLCADRARQEEFVDLLYAEIGPDGLEGEEARRLTGFSANLFIMLTAWEGAGVWLMGRLFDLGRGYLDFLDLWENAARAIGHIKDRAAGRELARTAAAILKPAPKKRLSSGEWRAKALFEALALGKTPPRPQGDDWPDFMREADLVEFLNRMISGRRKRR